MLLGSVPRPPKKPKSSISTQSARQSTVSTAIVGRSSLGWPLSRPAPIAPSAITATRLTAKPWAAVKLPKPTTQRAKRAGWGVPDIDWTMPVRVPGEPCRLPCQNPRPGQACSTAMPTKNRPMAARILRPSCGVCQARSGRASKAPAAQ